ncbi:hypothetical protein BpHYR1_008642 [Brachionus plicatilis]|uniref:Transmembrane protein n=1 Tax=Brachionus plicatilis TaxID=10195 RepID=A0A3M7TAF4_BRAPC|nr:hypothetical protein BpHYR1_008642 [Brachionus plicatilis]
MIRNSLMTEQDASRKFYQECTATSFRRKTHIQKSKKLFPFVEKQNILVDLEDKNILTKNVMKPFFIAIDIIHLSAVILKLDKLLKITIKSKEIIVGKLIFLFKHSACITLMAAMMAIKYIFVKNKLWWILKILIFSVNRTKIKALHYLLAKKKFYSIFKSLGNSLEDRVQFQYLILNSLLGIDRFTKERNTMIFHIQP